MGKDIMERYVQMRESCGLQAFNIVIYLKDIQVNR